MGLGSGEFRSNTQLVGGWLWKFMNRDDDTDTPSGGVWHDGSWTGPVRDNGGHYFSAKNPRFGDGGAKGNGVTDDTAAFEAMIAFANARGSTGSSGKETTGTCFLIPPGVYNIPNGLTTSINVDNVWFVGDPDSSIIKGQTGTIFNWGGGLSAGNAYGGGISGLKFYYTNADANALCINVERGVHLRFQHIRLRDAGQFVRLGNTANGTSASSQHFHDIMGYVKNLGVPTFELQNGAGFRLGESYIFTNIAAPTGTDAHTATAGQNFIECDSGDWDTVNVTNVNCNRYYRSIYAHAESGDNLNNWFFTNFFGDYAAYGAYLHSNGGNIRTHRYTNCWFVGTDGMGFQTDGGGTGLLEDIRLTQCKALITGTHGFALYKGDGVSLVDCETLANGRLDTGYGILLGASGKVTNNITIRGGRHGLDGSTVTPFSAQATYGVFVTADAKRYTITDVRATGSTNAFSIADPSTQATSCYVRGNYKTDGAKANYHATGTITVPSSGAAWTNSSPFIKHYYISGGTVSQVNKGATRVSTATTGLFVELRPGEAWTITYSGVPQVYEEILT